MPGNVAFSVRGQARLLTETHLHRPCAEAPPEGILRARPDDVGED